MTSKKHYYSLSRDFTLLALAVLLATLTLSAWITWATFADNAIRTTEYLKREADRIDRALAVEMENAGYLLESLGRQISRTGVRNTDEIARLLNAFDNPAKGNMLISWATPGQFAIIASNKGVLKKYVDVSDRDYIKKALAEPWKPQMGRPVIGRITQKRVLPMALGLTNLDGEFIGTLIITLNVHELTREIRRQLHDQHVHFMVLSTTMIPLTETADENAPVSGGILSADRLSDIDFSDDPARLISRPIITNNKQPYLYYKASSVYPYLTYIGSSEGIDERKLSGLLIPRLAQAAGMAIFLLLLLWIVRIRVLRPIETLSEYTAMITRGKPPQWQDQPGPEEIGKLAGEIKKIGQYFRERHQIEEELLIKNHYLGRVRETAQIMNLSRTRFLDMIATELGKHLSQIQGQIEQLRNLPHEKKDPWLRPAHEINKHSVELQRMIADIRTVSRLEQDSLLLHESPVNVSQVIHRAIRKFQDIPHHRHIEFKLRLDEKLPKLLIDEDRFLLILISLFTTAGMQLSPGSTIVVEALTEKTAHGDEEYVFMMKYNLLDTETSNPDIVRQVSEDKRATDLVLRTEGINLALARMLVMRHQGVIDIQVSSNNICRTYLRFPARRIHRPRRKPVDETEG